MLAGSLAVRFFRTAARLDALLFLRQLLCNRRILRIGVCRLLCCRRRKSGVGNAADRRCRASQRPAQLLRVIRQTNDRYVFLFGVTLGTPRNICSGICCQQQQTRFPCENGIGNSIVTADQLSR